MSGKELRRNSLEMDLDTESATVIGNTVEENTRAGLAELFWRCIHWDSEPYGQLFSSF